MVLLLSRVITDGGWSQLAYNGLKELEGANGWLKEIAAPKSDKIVQIGKK